LHSASCTNSDIEVPFYISLPAGRLAGGFAICEHKIPLDGIHDDM
jgi:hypothetical protein